jgi:filamentous hemagglutinin family protein
MFLLVLKCCRLFRFSAYSLGFVGLLHGSHSVFAAPQGGQVQSGEATIQQSIVAGQSVTTITQSTPKTSLSWQKFNIGIGESVRFVQPGASSVTVNRISDPNGSKILGQLSANGQVWLINPAGVYFGPGAQINVGGLLASSINLPDHTDPLQLRGPLTSADSTSSVVNEGRITTSEGGYAALLGANVSSWGSISSPGGRILMLGDKQSGTVYLNGRLDTYSLVNSGAGFVETSAARVRIDEAARVSTRNADGSSGTWLIDPTDFTISSGSGTSTTSSIGASTLSTSLGSSSVSIATDNSSGSDSGHIYVNSAVSWSSATQLTLSAYNDIYINAPITSSLSSGKLSLLYGQGSSSGTISGVAADYHVNAPVSLAAGANFSTQLGSNAANLKSYQVITSLGSKGSTTGTDLQGMNGDLTANYALGADIDASNTTTWSTNANYKGFTKIGNNTTTADYYSGSFAGLGHVISDLYLYRPLVGLSLIHI